MADVPVLIRSGCHKRRKHAGEDRGFLLGILRGAGKPAVPMAVMLGAWCVFRVIFVNIAVSIYHSALVIYITYPVTWLLSTVIFAVYLTRSNWLHAMDKDRI